MFLLVSLQSNIYITLLGQGLGWSGHVLGGDRPQSKSPASGEGGRRWGARAWISLSLYLSIYLYLSLYVYIYI